MSSSTEGKFEDLPSLKQKDLSETRAKVSPNPQKQEPIKKLLRTISNSKNMNQESLASRYTRIVGVVAAYWFVSITLVFVNKTLLSGGSSLNAPLFITWYQCAVTAAACYAAIQFFSSNDATAAATKGQLSPDILKKVMPLSVVFVSMITFNNLCLKNVGISFYYISRSLTTVFNVALTYTILGQKTSMKAIGCCGIIIVGYFLGFSEERDSKADETTESESSLMMGVIYGVLASLFVSLYAIYIKRVLPVVNDDVWLLTFYNNINALILFMPLILVTGELPVIASFQDLFTFHFILLMTLGGLFGFAIGYVTGMQVKVTSPLTHNISGTAKAAAQTVIATQWNAEVKSFEWWISNAVVLIGSSAYARVKQLEMAEHSRQKETLPTKSTSSEKSSTA